MMSLTGRTAACGGWPSAGAPDDRRPAVAGSACGRSWLHFVFVHLPLTMVRHSGVMEQFLIPARPDLQKARAEWLAALAAERRLSPLTVEAYERDTRQFLHFMTGHN